MPLEVLLLLFGCSDPVIDQSWRDTRFFQITGAVDASLTVNAGEINGAIIWMWSDSGQWRARVEHTPFEARLVSYRMAIPGPPATDRWVSSGAITDPAVSDPLLIGLPIVYQSVNPSLSAFTVNTGALWTWSVEGGDLVDAIGLSEGHIVGVPSDYSVMGAVNDGQARPCGLEQLTDGLTLYRDDGEGCARWRPLAPAGSRTEFQGVDLWPLEHTR